MPNRVVNTPTIQEVNDKLLLRLETLIDSASPEELLSITEAVAKLNSSYKSNDRLDKPESDEERTERMQREVFGEALSEAEIVQ